jgi:hypothetical protein
MCQTLFNFTVGGMLFVPMSTELEASPFSVECAISGPIPGGWGYLVVLKSPEDWTECERDPWGFISSRLGATREELVEYVENDALVRCCATTRAKTRCKHRGDQMQCLGFKEWLSVTREGWRCANHSP